MKAELDNRLGSIQIPKEAVAKLPVDGLRPTHRYRSRNTRSWSRRSMANTRFKKRTVKGKTTTTRRLALRKRSS